MAKNLKELRLKKIIKSAVYEALEDFALGKAMEEGEKTGKVSENDIITCP